MLLIFCGNFFGAKDIGGGMSMCENVSVEGGKIKNNNGNRMEGRILGSM